MDALNDVLDTNVSSIIPLKLYSIPFRASPKIPILGLEMKVGASQSDFFSFLTSVDGYKMLDPDSDPADFSKAISGPWPLAQGNNNSQRHGQIEYAHLHGLMNFMDIVVMNVKDYTKTRFMSASVQVSAKPGCSGFYDRDEKLKSVENRRRIPFLGFYQVLSNRGDNAQECHFRVFQWLDLLQ